MSALFRHATHTREAKQEVLKRAETLVADVPPKKQAYLEGRLAGKSKRQAALDAGFSKSMADHASTKIETRDVREAFAALIRETVPPERIVKVISDGLEAMETKFFAEKGVVKDQRDVISWPERRQYAELAAEYGGYHILEKGEREQGGGVILILPDTLTQHPSSRQTWARQRPVQCSFFQTWWRKRRMPSLLIAFRGDHGTPYAVYEGERGADGKLKILRTIFKPHPAQIEFFSAKEKHVLLHGNRGCGKSASLLWKAIQTAYLVPGCRVAIFRKTWPELKRSIWDEMLKLPANLYNDLNLSEHTAIIKARDRDGTFKDSKIWFVNAQNVEDARKVLSFEVHTLLIDEWAECELEIWRFISGSVRSPLAVDLAGRLAPAQILGA